MNIKMSIVMLKKYLCDEKELETLRACNAFPMTLEQFLYNLKFQNWKKDQEIERLTDLHLASILQTGEFKLVNCNLQKRLRVMENIIMKRKRSKVLIFAERMKKLIRKFELEFDLSDIE